ncbi:MAG TPA: 1-acyl-sn-glycerol-3-phosphate acyltransferase, partial [Usitatibacter sp.]|nr:1-acyl-sn-glycerol-3-phosphate acyltransferase [Usitatibacter sp.]
MSLPRLGANIPRRGSRALAAFGRFVLWSLRFRVEGEIPDLPKFVIAIAPHTSNWDFVVGAAAMFALDLRLAFIGKHTLFRGPFAAVLRWMGGIPVDRTSPHGVVAESIEGFSRSHRRILVIAPEGTRKHVARFKSGFLHIARGAGVPVMLASLDFGARCIRLGPTLDVPQDIEAELHRIEIAEHQAHQQCRPGAPLGEDQRGERDEAASRGHALHEAGGLRDGQVPARHAAQHAANDDRLV